jgi:hypothetical protein
MMFTMPEKLLIAFMIFLLAALATDSVLAEGIEYSTPTKPVVCENPSTYTDGTPLSEPDILATTLYISPPPASTTRWEQPPPPWASPCCRLRSLFPKR